MTAAPALPVLPPLLKPEPHPLLPVLSDDEIMALLDRPKGRELYTAWYNARQERIREADEETGEPFAHGFELPHWTDADMQLRESKAGLYTAGGKRASKSEWAGKRFIQAAMAFPRGKLWAFQGNETTSRATQQQLVWKYLPKRIKALNGKSRHGFAKINYSRDGGFTENVLVLPNQTEIYFLTYGADPKNYQGWEIGAYVKPDMRHLLTSSEHLHVHNIGAWADEDMPMDWLATLEMRCATRTSKIVWTFSTLEGITTAIKEVIGSPKTIQSRRADLLNEHERFVGDCPPGHMPYIQTCTRPGWRAIYFHSDLNLFGDNWANVQSICKGKTFSFIAENAYGWGEDVRQRAWPMFSGVNVIEVEQLPERGTNYHFTDPAGARPWASVWVRVAEGNPPKLYIYRDWPNAQRFGPWAEPSNENPDGVAARGQKGLGYGFTKYKTTWLECERISVPYPIIEMSATWRDGVLEMVPAEVEEMLVKQVRDPQQRERIREAILALDPLDTLRERIHRRYIDPRAGRDEKTAQKGGTCAIDELAKQEIDPRTGTLLAPGMRFEPASGVLIETGIAAVNALLDWDKLQPLCPLVNEPHLYVASNCLQVIWALNNYTGEGGEHGGCKDFADLLRYLALARLKYIAPGMVKTSGGGSY